MNPWIVRTSPFEVPKKAEPTYGEGWHEWKDASGVGQRHDFPLDSDYCWCGTYIPWRADLEQLQQQQAE